MPGGALRHKMTKTCRKQNKTKQNHNPVLGVLAWEQTGRVTLKIQIKETHIEIQVKDHSQTTESIHQSGCADKEI